MDRRAAAESLLLFLLLVSQTQAKKKPGNFFTLCKKSDPNLSKCFLDSVMGAQSNIIAGIPDLKMPPFDPLFIPEIAMIQGEGNFKMSFIMKNLTLSGHKDTVYTEFKVDKKVEKISYTSFSKTIHMEGDYSINGRVLVLPVNGQGKAIFDLFNVTNVGNIKLGRYEKNGQTYLRCDGFDLKVEPGLVKSHLSNLFNGDKLLGETTNKFFNENWKDTFNAYKDLPGQAFAEVFKTILNNAFSTFPEKDWFLD